MSRKTEIVIIGGGIIGLVIAWRLSRNGHQVTVLERGQAGREASWAAAGMLAPHCETDQADRFFELCRASLDAYPDFLHLLQQETGCPIAHNGAGALVPALSDGDQQKLEERRQRQHDAGLPVEIITAKNARRLEPNLTGKIQMALRYPADHQVENRDLIFALVQAVRKHGGVVRENMEVRRLLTDRTGVIGAETAEGMVETNTVVLATGSWARYMAGIPDSFRPPIRPVHGQMLALATGDDKPFRHTIYTGKIYLVPRANGRLLVGATVEEKGFRKEVTVEGVLNLMQGALRLAPSLKSFPLEATWSGLRPKSTDGLPILGPTSIPGLYMATGHYRNGILLAPITGDLITEVIEGRSIPDSIKPFLPDRFYQSDHREVKQ